MLNKTPKSTEGFTLVEIMIVVAIIALLAAIALPNFLRARKRSQATSIINDLRQIDQAMDQYSVDAAKTSGFSPAWADIQNYLKTDTNLYNTGNDLFGDSYGPFTVDSITQVPTSAFNTLSDVADAGFWGQYYSQQSGDASNGSTNPYAAFNASNPLTIDEVNALVTGNSPIGILNSVLASGGTPTPAQVTAAQQENTQLNQVYASGGFGQYTANYTNSITNNYSNGTTSMTNYMTQPGNQ